MNEHEGARTVADHLVGDVDVPAPCVLNGRDVDHAPSQLEPHGLS